jgi:hypothetical protein
VHLSIPVARQGDRSRRRLDPRVESAAAVASRRISRVPLCAGLHRPGSHPCRCRRCNDPQPLAGRLGVCAAVSAAVRPRLPLRLWAAPDGLRRPACARPPDVTTTVSGRRYLRRMTSDPIPEPNLWDEDGSPETVYLTRVPDQTTADGWLVPSVDVGSWLPLEVGDRVVALDKSSPDEFLVEVAEIRQWFGEVYYEVRHLADLDPAAEPALDSARTWLAP